MFDLHRDSVMWYLGRKLEEAGEVQRAMMERRLEREVEKGRSVLYKVKGSATAMENRVAEGINGRAAEGGSGGEYSGGKGPVVGDESRREIEQQLSPEQLQLFARENRDMLKHYEDTLDQVRYVRLESPLVCQCAKCCLNSARQSDLCLRSLSFRLHWSRISTCKAPIFRNLLHTHCQQRRMWAGGIKS